MNDFLPSNYEVPQSEGNYMKLKQGSNTLRVLSSAIVGYEYWNKESKPIRSRVPFTETPDDAKLDNGQFKPKHFWAFLVYNYDAKKVQILEVTQSTIQSAIEALVKNPKWGTPLKYDICITREGEKLDTEYAVVPEPHSDAPVLNIPPVNLEALFSGADPFAQ